MIDTQAAARGFASAFGRAPAAVGRAPGRVNLIGEHTDYNDGLVLPVPLPLGTAVAVGRNDQGRLRAVSALGDLREERPMGSPVQGSWTDYLLGACAEAGITHGVDIAVVSDLPAGASVSSSAALCVAALRALADMQGQPMDGADLALAAQRIENEFVGVACGLMDQMVCATGQPGHALFFDTRAMQTRPVPLIKGLCLLTIHSGQTRRLADGAYNDRRAACERAAAAMGVASLRDAAEADLGRVADDADRASARHVVTENARVTEAVTVLEAGDGPALGAILNAGHASLSRDFRVSTPLVDALTQAARDAGALGARITGAGFGGCFIVLAEPDRADAILHAVRSVNADAWEVCRITA